VGLLMVGEGLQGGRLPGRFAMMCSPNVVLTVR